MTEELHEITLIFSLVSQTSLEISLIRDQILIHENVKLVP